MGLDMYLSARVQRFRPFGVEDNDHERQALVAAADACGLVNPSGNIDGISIQRECAYWRKANAIHSWFVREIQDGEDECRPHYVPRQKLVELLDTCKKLLVNKSPSEAMETLPPVEGFFFGSTDINPWYWQGIQHTVDQLTECLKMSDDVSFYYRSSW